MFSVYEEGSLGSRAERGGYQPLLDLTVCIYLVRNNAIFGEKSDGEFFFTPELREEE